MPDAVVVLLEVLWASAGIVLLLLYLRQATVPLWRSIDNRRRLQRQLRAWLAFRGRALFLAAVRNDEAINGLRALRERVRGRLLPRMPSPRDTEFSARKRLLQRPEREASRQTFVGWILRYLFLPIVIVKEWLIAPLYNDVFAKLIDDYVIQQLQKKAIGNDIAGLVLRDVTCVPAGALLDTAAGLPPGAEAELVNRANSRLVVVIDRLRKELNVSFPVGPELEEFFRHAMQGEGDPAAALVHTSYFDCEIVSAAIAERLCGAAPKLETENGETRPSGGAAVVPRWTEVVREQPSGSRLGFVSWVIRLAIKLVILLLPVVLLAAGGLAVSYPYSRSFQRKWASQLQSAHTVAVEDFVTWTGDPRRPYVTSPAVRWSVALGLVDPMVDEKYLGETLAGRATKCSFYGSIGQKYAQLGKLRYSARAFSSAIREVHNARNAGDDWVICVYRMAPALRIAKRFVSPGEYRELAERLFEGLDPADADRIRDQLQKHLQGPGDQRFERNMIRSKGGDRYHQQGKMRFYSGPRMQKNP